MASEFDILQPFFNEQYYLNTYPDAPGSFASGWEHFKAIGLPEHRSPSSGYDRAYYLTQSIDNFGASGQRDLIMALDGDDLIKAYAGADEIYGGNGNDIINGGPGADSMNGEGGDDLYVVDDPNDVVNETANNGIDVVISTQNYVLTDNVETLILTNSNDIEGTGNDSNNRIVGNGGKNQLVGGNGNDTLVGNAGNDTLLGNAGNDFLNGGDGNDILNSDIGADSMNGGAGNDTFVIGKNAGGATAAGADVIVDFTNGTDLIELTGGLTFEDLQIFDSSIGDTVIKDPTTGEFLALLKGVSSSTIDTNDFVVEMQALPAEITSNTVKFAPGDSEQAIAATGAPSITIGTQTIYIGTWQKTSINQDPIIASFDSANSANNWVRTDYESTGADGRGYGLFWDGDDLYSVFSTDGTQGSASEDFRRAAADAQQSWLRSYGQGGGAKIAVVAKIDELTGEMTDAAFLSAVLSSGSSNSLKVTDLSVNNSGNLEVSANSFFNPRNPNGSAMTKVGSEGSPFDYTVEIQPDLSRVVSTSAVGWVS